MTASKLKALYESNARPPAGLFFCRENMRYWGDTMKNFGVRDGGFLRLYSGGVVEVWELYRKHGRGYNSAGHCAYFRKDDGQEVFGEIVA